MSARRSSFVALLHALLALCGACRVGDPLVDKKYVQPPSPFMLPGCKMPEGCAEPFELEVSMPSAAPLRRRACAPACSSDAAPITETDADDAFAMPFACEPAEPLDAASNRELSCTNKRFVAGRATSATHANVVTAARWRDMNVMLEADAPVEIVVSGSELVDVRLHLSGPVAVRFQGDTVLDGVSLSSASAEAGVAFDEVKPERITIGDDASAFLGHVAARHSAFYKASFVAGSVELDSARLTAAFVSTASLVANDGAFIDVLLDVGEATFAPAALDTVDVRACGSLTFFGSMLENMRIPSCSDEATRMYATELNEGALDGTVVGDDCTLSDVRIGQNEPSDLVLWKSTVQLATFCDHLSSLKVPQHAVQCSACSERAFDPLDKGCLLPGESRMVDDLAPLDLGKRSNFCEAITMLESCTPPLPARTRPIDTTD